MKTSAAITAPAHPVRGEAAAASYLNGAARFTLDGSALLEQRMAALCAEILKGVQVLIPSAKLEALVLGGGYGRGQGGVLKTPAGDRPYNDLEFYIFLRGQRLWNERKFGAALHALGEQLSKDAGLHVEFKVDSLARFRRGPVTMFSYDLVSGHRRIFGPDTTFAGCEHHLDGAEIPLDEATRLLFNRCTGLLLAKEYLRRRELTPEQADFVGRNLAKARLALGDVVLAAFGKYHWNCLERHVRLKGLASTEQFPWLTELLRLHGLGIEFKFRPTRTPRALKAYRDEHREIAGLALDVWLWLESRRLNRRFPSIRDYAFSMVEKCSGAFTWRSLLLNVREFGPSTIFDDMANRYPRERLLNSLPLLLWDEPLNDLRVRRHLQNMLRTATSDWQSFVATYKAMWPSFS